MPLVAVNKARRLRAAEAARAATGPYALADRHVDPVSRAVLAAARTVVSPAAVLEIHRRAIGHAPSAAIDPLLEHIVWDEGLQDQEVAAAFVSLMSEVGEVEKRKRRVPTIRVNPRSLEWAKQRGSKLVREISADTRKTIRGIVERALTRGERADTMAAAIRRAVGLLGREEAAVDRRRALLIDQGVTEARAEALSDKYAAELLEARAMRIARTETIAAQNQGLLSTWQDASAEGAFPQGVVRVWSSAPASDNPNRPCEHCLEVDGQAVALDDPFESSEYGEVMTPPLHPLCRCTMTLRRGEG